MARKQMQVNFKSYFDIAKIDQRKFNKVKLKACKKNKTAQDNVNYIVFKERPDRAPPWIIIIAN